MKTDKPLSAKHKRFVRLVRRGQSATKSYAAAYNVPNSLSTRTASCRLMKDTRIIAAINQGRPKPASEVNKPAATEQGKAPIPANNFDNTSVNISEPPKSIINPLPFDNWGTDAEVLPTEEKQTISELEKQIREKAGLPEIPRRFTLPSPKYQRPNAPNAQSEAEALRRRLRLQAITPKPKGEW